MTSLPNRPHHGDCEAVRQAKDKDEQVRMTRSRVKSQIATGELTAAAVILTARWEIGRMPIAEVLGSQRHWGAVRCRRFLAAVRIGETKTIGSMTKRQRLATAAELNRDRTLSKPTPNVLRANPQLN
jgi:hypothetical protein